MFHKRHLATVLKPPKIDRTAGDLRSQNVPNMVAHQSYIALRRTENTSLSSDVLTPASGSEFAERECIVGWPEWSRSWSRG